MCYRIQGAYLVADSLFLSAKRVETSVTCVKEFCRMGRKVNTVEVIIEIIYIKISSSSKWIDELANQIVLRPLSCHVTWLYLTQFSWIYIALYLLVPQFVPHFVPHFFLVPRLPHFEVQSRVFWRQISWNWCFENYLLYFGSMILAPGFRRYHLLLLTKVRFWSVFDQSKLLYGSLFRLSCLYWL